jgi:serine/threonine-protein kinase
MFTPGTLLAGKYELLEIAGQGGMATVWRARARGVGGFSKNLAIKVMLQRLCSDRHFVELFVEEARVSSQLQHPNVVQISDFGEHDGVYFLAMEWVDGLDLLDYCRSFTDQGYFMPWAALAIIAVEVLKGMHAAHTHRDEQGNPSPIFHRDVTPHNILLGVNGVVKLTDFGLAKASDRVEAGRAGMAGMAVVAGAGPGPSVPGLALPPDVSGTSNTMSGSSVVGTPQFMSPEQCRGLPTDPRSDVYSMGATYYALLTGSSPYYEAGDAVAVMTAHCTAPVPDPRSRIPEIPESCAAIVMRAMAKEPGDRFRSAAEMLAALESVLAAPAAAASGDASAEWARFMENAPASAGVGLKSSISQPMVIGRPAGRPRKGGGLMLIGVGVGTAVVLAGAFLATMWLMRPGPEPVPPPPPPPVVKKTVPPPKPYTPPPPPEVPVPPDLVDPSTTNPPTTNPPRPDPEPPAFPRQPWPGKPQGLVWLYDSRWADNLLPDGRECRLVPHRGDPGFGGRGQIVTAEGSFKADSAAAALLAACRKTNELTLEATLRVDRLNQSGPARIITFSKDGSERNFTLGQEGDSLILRLRTSDGDENGTKPQVTLCKVIPDRSFHIVVSYSPGRLRCWRDGKPVFPSAQPSGDFSNWEAFELVFGDEYEDRRRWAGEIEGVALLNRAIDDREAAWRHRMAEDRLRRSERN